jgi:hypothetical protein
MLADLVSTSVLTEATLYIIIYCAGVEAQDLRGAFPPNGMRFGGFVSSVVLRDVKLPVGPWGSKSALADLEPHGLTGICLLNSGRTSCLRLFGPRAAAHYIQPAQLWEDCGHAPVLPTELCAFLAGCVSHLGFGCHVPRADGNCPRGV